MPRDKTVSHEKIIKAAMQEFLEKGYEQASMKAVADAVGMTSAALYRHFASKQDMFAALVQPAIAALEEWKQGHRASWDAAIGNEDISDMWSFENNSNDASLILDIAYQQPEAFRLLLFRAAGTPYESFLHDMIEMNTEEMLSFQQQCKARGCQVREVQLDEMHMLITAYCTALLEPLEHGYAKEDAMRYLKTMVEFFTPGWRMITGM